MAEEPQKENSNNSSVSYYSKGSAVAAALDMIIRTKTNGKKSVAVLIDPDKTKPERLTKIIDNIVYSSIPRGAVLDV